MDFDFTEAQEILKTSARRFLKMECPTERVREAIDDELGYGPDLWRKMADLGWLGLTLPVAYGGGGSSFLDLVLLQEEMGRALTPSPFIASVVLSGGVILAAGTEDQKRSFLPGIADGTVIMTLALLEPGGRWDAAGIHVAAAPSGGDYIINGTKLFVPYAHVADTLICVARTRDNGNKEEGITLFIVDANLKGIHREALKTITGENLCEVSFEDVVVSRADIIGEADQGWPIVERILCEGTIAECGAMVGGARRVLEMTVDYAKQRIQFGVPIGTFQAVQHKCADILTAVDGATFITYNAAWALSENAPDASLAVSKAKAWCSDIYTHVTSEGVQILGGLGFTQEHDMQLYFRRARASELAFGDSQFHREKLAGMLNI